MYNGNYQWEILDVVAKRKFERKGVKIEVTLEITRPTFDNGEKGDPKLSLLLDRIETRIGSSKRNYIRFTYGDVDEIRAVRALFLSLNEEIMQKAIEDCQCIPDPIESNGSPKRQRNHSLTE